MTCFLVSTSLTMTFLIKHICLVTRKWLVVAYLGNSLTLKVLFCLELNEFDTDFRNLC